MSRQVLGLSQAELDSGDWNADLLMTELLIEEIRKNKSIIKDLWGEAQSKNRNRVVSGTEGVEVFKASTLKGLSLDFKFGWRVKNGEFTGEELVLAKTKFSEAVGVLVEYATQLGMHLKLPEDCRYEPVIEHMFSSKHVEWGKRLATFKANGGFSPDGSLIVKAMVYLPTWDADGLLTRINHCSGHAVQIDKKHGTEIDGNYSVTDNFNDVTASFVMPAMPPIPIIACFEDFIDFKAGPYAGTTYVEKKAQQKFSAMVESVKQEWVTGRLALSVGLVAPLNPT